jgi:hypothetical protein
MKMIMTGGSDCGAEIAGIKDMEVKKLIVIAFLVFVIILSAQSPAAGALPFPPNGQGSAWSLRETVHGIPYRCRWTASTRLMPRN